MSQTNLEEIDVSDLSFEELDSLLNEVEGKPNNNLEADTNAESQTDKEETDIETSSTDVENVDVNATESSDKTSDVDKADVEDNTEEKESIEPQFQGKSKDDLLEMQRNATKKISQQNNQIYHLELRVYRPGFLLQHQYTFYHFLELCKPFYQSIHPSDYIFSLFSL